MTPNPVCYNGTNLPDNAIHAGHVSLGIVPKDYRADTAQNWRAGISPNGAVVLYSNTYDLGLTDQASAEPRIWWTNPATGNANDFRLKITELISRLPERSGDNYSVFATYDDAIDWLDSNPGKYALINDNYPEYYLPGEWCIFNIESGFFASYPATGLHIRNLANPNLTIGNDYTGAAFSWNGFSLTNVSGSLNTGTIGTEPGLVYDSTGHILSVDTMAGSRYVGNNIVFETVLRIPYDENLAVLFTLYDSSNSSEVVRFEWDPQTLSFSAHYPSLGSVIEFEPVTTPWTGNVHIAVSVPASDTNESLEATSLLVNGTSYAVRTTTGSNYEWNNTTYFQIGNNRGLNKPITSLKSAKAYVVQPLRATEVMDNIKSINYPIVSALY